MDDTDPGLPTKPKKTSVKLRARVKTRNIAPGGDLSKLKQQFVVEVLMNRQWAQGSDAAGPFRFDTKEAAEAKAATLEGLVIDVS